MVGDPERAGLVYVVGLVLLAAVLVGIGVLDGLLVLSGRHSVTDWLRQHPGYFWVPAAAMVLFLILLSMHLFWQITK